MTRTQTHANKHIHIHIHLHIHIHIHVHIHTQTTHKRATTSAHIHIYAHTHTGHFCIQTAYVCIKRVKTQQRPAYDFVKKSQNQPIFFLIPCQHGFSLQCFTRASKLKVEPAAALLQANRHDIWPCKLRHLVPGENLGFLHLQAV